MCEAGETQQGLKWWMHDHICSWCELSGGGQSSVSVGDAHSNLIYSLCEGIHAVVVPLRLLWCMFVGVHSCDVDCSRCHEVGQVCLLSLGA